MDIEIEPLHPRFGCKVKNLNLLKGMSPSEFSDLERLIEDYSLVLLTDQEMDDDSQVAFTRRFGEPEFNHVIFGNTGRYEYIGRIGNIDKDGSQLPASSKRVVFGTGNEMWHSDASFREVPAFLSLSYAYEVTPYGGEIEFVSTRAAYDELPEVLKKDMEHLIVVHDYVFSRSKVGVDVVSNSLANSLPPVQQKLVRTNPITGDKNYFVGSHARTIVGWDDVKSRSLLDDLLRRAVKLENRYKHTWRARDFLIWDNRCLLHRGESYDADKHRRRMHQTRVRGVGSTLDEDIIYESTT